MFSYNFLTNEKIDEKIDTKSSSEKILTTNLEKVKNLKVARSRTDATVYNISMVIKYKKIKNLLIFKEGRLKGGNKDLVN